TEVSFAGRTILTRQTPVEPCGDHPASFVRIVLPLSSPQLWTPDHPALYDARIVLSRNGQPLDEVSTYFGMRSVSLSKDNQGRSRILLNGESLFQLGVLDEGYWPDG